MPSSSNWTHDLHDVEQNAANFDDKKTLCNDDSNSMINSSENEYDRQVNSNACKILLFATR